MSPAQPCCACHRCSCTGGWKQPDSTWRTSASRDLVSLLCPFAEPEIGFPVCRLWAYILNWQVFFLILQEKYISHPSLLKRYITISCHSPPFLHAQNDSATTAFLQGSLCSSLPLAGTQARLPWPAPRAAPHSGLDIEPLLHRGFPYPLPLRPHPLSPNPPVSLNRHSISVCLCNISFSSLDWRARPWRQLGSLLYYQQLV